MFRRHSRCSVVSRRWKLKRTNKKVVRSEVDSIQKTILDAYKITPYSDLESINFKRDPNPGIKYTTEWTQDLEEDIIGGIVELQETFKKQREELKTAIIGDLKLVGLDEAAKAIEEKGIPAVEWLASKLGISHRYMRDTIKAETGKTSVDQINLFLVEEAKDLLLAPKASISETAYKLGFEYPQYFSRLFKKKEGMSPTEFREKYRMN